eukprot:COSAG02_NODE_245_length_27293_cov_16.488012_4_plen_71_part_00
MNVTGRAYFQLTNEIVENRVQTVQDAVRALGDVMSASCVASVARLDEKGQRVQKRAWLEFQTYEYGYTNF